MSINMFVYVPGVLLDDVKLKFPSFLGGTGNKMKSEDCTHACS
jgi:hypothetical protein